MSKQKKIVVYYTNDLHGRLSTHDDEELSIGIDKISKVVNLSLLKNKNTFWLDAGDFTHGTPRMTFGDLDSLIKTLNATHLNAICTGNHDYNITMDNLLKLAKELKLQILSANTINKDNGIPALLPYMIYTADLNQDDSIGKEGNSNDSQLEDIKIGVFGLSTPETAYKTNPNNVKDVIFANPIETAKNMVRLLRNNCDMIIALTHLGLDDSSEFTSKRLAEEVDGIDLIVDGHSHTELKHGLKVKNTLIVQTGAHGHYLGRAVITFKDKMITKMTTRLLDETSVDKYIKNPDSYIENRLDEIDTVTNLALNKVIAHTERELIGEREIVRQKESEIGNFFSDALRWKTKADIAILNGGTIRTGLPKGDITFKDIISVFPFNNTIQMAEISGKLIKEMLEHSVFSVPASFGGFLSVSGMTFSFDSKEPIGNKVKEIMVGNEPIDENKIYTIATADFLFVGGDDYSMLKGLKLIGDFGALENTISEYLNEVGIIDSSIKLGRIIKKKSPIYLG